MCRTHRRIHLQEGIQSHIGDTAMKVLCHTYGKTFLPQDSRSDISGISFFVTTLKSITVSSLVAVETSSTRETDTERWPWYVSMKELLSRVDRFLPTQQIEVVCPFKNWFFADQ
jgi:hypothetical protein